MSFFIKQLLVDRGSDMCRISNGASWSDLVVPLVDILWSKTLYKQIGGFPLSQPLSLSLCIYQSLSLSTLFSDYRHRQPPQETAPLPLFLHRSASDETFQPATGEATTSNSVEKLLSLPIATIIATPVPFGRDYDEIFRQTPTPTNFNFSDST